MPAVSIEGVRRNFGISSVYRNWLLWRLRWEETSLASVAQIVRWFKHMSPMTASAWFGEIDTIDASLVLYMIDLGYLPIIAPLGWGPQG